MHISVFLQSDKPAYKQIYEQLSEQIISGRIAAGEALPPIRTVSAQTGVSVITVRSAWERLEADGLIETRAGSGCYVAALTEKEKEEQRRRLLPVAEFVAKAKKTGLSYDTVCELLRAEWEKDGT